MCSPANSAITHNPSMPIRRTARRPQATHTSQPASEPSRLIKATVARNGSCVSNCANKVEPVNRSGRFRRIVSRLPPLASAGASRPNAAWEV